MNQRGQERKRKAMRKMAGKRKEMERKGNYRTGKMKDEKKNRIERNGGGKQRGKKKSDNIKRKCGNNRTGKGVEERKEKKVQMKRTRQWKWKKSVERRGEGKKKIIKK